MNVALYGARRSLWSMTERGSAALNRSADAIAIGKSSMSWRDDTLSVSFDEWTAPLPRRIRGTIVVRAPTLLAEVYTLDPAGVHRWRPMAPMATVEVELDAPAQRWRGLAYFDCNWGGAPLEDMFGAWQWSRAHSSRGAQVHYDVTLRDGAQRGLSLLFERNGPRVIDAPPASRVLEPTLWRMPRDVRSETPPMLVRTLEDAPFYARSWLKADVDCGSADIVHESLSLDRLRSPIVRAMLPFRMPRRTV
jgi:carotenoid 1,2-hydratase